MSEVLNEGIRENWIPTNDQDAEWCLAQKRNAEAEKQKWIDFYEEQKRKVIESCDLTIHNMEAYLETYFQDVPHKVTKTQESYQLPSGKLVMKHQEPEYERDDSKVIEWLKENCDGHYIKIKESLDWAGLKKSCQVIGNCLVTEDGQIIPCVNVIERMDIFKVE